MDTTSLDSIDLAAFDPGQWADGANTLDVGDTRISLRTPADSATLTLSQDDAAGTEALVTATADGTVTLRLDVPLGDAVGFWHPDAGWERTLPADWSAWRGLSLVRSAPVGCLYDTAGRSLLALAANRTVQKSWIRFGVSEERKRFGVWLRLSLTAGQTCRVRISAPGTTMAAALRRLRQWLVGLPGGEPLPVPEFARTPVYSTWYAFTQDVTAAEVEEEAALAAALGCGQLFLDDGWQLLGNGRGYAGCGDWQPDPFKFPDFRAHVSTVRRAGLHYTAWIAPLLLGERSSAHQAWAPYAPHHVPHLDCFVLDPRHSEVRAHIVDTCRTLVDTYGLDGLKIDFLDEAMAYDAVPAPDQPAPGYIPDIGEAMAALLADIRDALRALRGDQFVIELRQPYIGPAMTALGNALRATDCPADPVANRIRTLDIALLAPCGAVHSDMVMWDPQATPESLARHFHGALHSVPQISVRLSRLSPSHRETLAFWLATWRRLAPVLTSGHYEPGRPDELFPQVTAAHGDQRVITNYTDRIVPLRTESWRSHSLINASTASRMVLDVSGPPRQVRARIHDARGRLQQATALTLTPGIHTIEVPPSGTCVLELASGLPAQGESSTQMP
ncbi:Melibiase [Streptomyces sp. ADI92-24]|uniref:glycoside hydrolase family 36 protein n=1 Tax=unclassified Streptomyces TaxID=2593676 RepID=UPI000F558742|nr:glycoside hydrolase family 36 protein [Streptomyces sp. ADI92-24]RPK37649.1 Melibiase [Streptomyces sp. ADI92-24]